MLDFQNFVLEFSKAMNQKQVEANLQLESIIQDEVTLKPIQKLEEINKSAQQIIASKNENALQEFINYFSNPQDLQVEFSQNEKQINKNQPLSETQKKQVKKQTKKSTNQGNHQIQIHSNQNISTLKQQQVLLEKKSKQIIKSSSSSSSSSASQKKGSKGVGQFSKNANSDTNNHQEVSKFQIYKNQLKTYEELDKYNNPTQPNQNRNIKNIHNSNQHSFSNQQTQKGHNQSRNIVQELQQMRLKQKERLTVKVKKSQLKKSKIGRIFKLNPQIQKKNQELRKHQAQEKMKANIAFLDSIKSQGRKQASPSYKEFNNFDSKDLNNLGSSLRIENKKRLEKLGFSDRSRMKISSTHLDTLQPTPSWNFLPPIQKNNSLRPKPYSIYHINQKSNEIFYNKLQNS